MTQWVSAPGTCRMIDPGPDRESPTCLSCGRVIIKTVRPSGATWWTHEDSTTGRVLTADEIVPPAEPTESLDSLYSLYRPDTTAFVKAAVLLGHTAKQANAFLDAPADGELTEDNDDDGTDARVGGVF